MSSKLSCIIALGAVLLVAAHAPADRGRPAQEKPRIGFDQSYSPQPNYTLWGKFSKLKQYLKSEFNASVNANTSGWTTSALNNYDVYIIPTRYTVAPSLSELYDLRQWVKDGGCLIILWHPLSIFDSTTQWEGNGLHNEVLEYFGMQVKSLAASSKSISTILSPFDSDPYTVNTVSGSGTLLTAWMHAATGNAKFLGWNAGGQPVASYNPKADKGMLFLIGNVAYFQNARIDNADNKNFLLNIVSFCLEGDNGGGGGGGGGDKPDLIIKVLKGKPRQQSAGGQLKIISRVRNKGKANAKATKIFFYLSPDKEYDASDIELGSTSVPAVKKKKRSKKIKKVVLIPLNTPTGKYYLIAIVDKQDKVDESNEDNNTRSSRKRINVQ